MDACQRSANDCICGSVSYNELQLRSGIGYNASWIPEGLHQCVPTPLCHSNAAPAMHLQATLATSMRASIVLVMGFEFSNVRQMFAADPWGSYYSSMLAAIRLVLSLRRVQTTLPITLLVSGERKPEWESLLLKLGVNIIVGPTVPRPPWSGHWHKGSFATLALLSLQFDRVIFLEMDTLVVRPIDHLVLAPAPAFVNHFDDFHCVPGSDVRPLWRTDREHALRVTLMAGIAVLAPSDGEWARVRALMEVWNQTDRLPLGADFSSQTVWRMLYPTYNELPVGYNAFQTAKLTDAAWRRVHMLHDSTVIRGRTTFGHHGYGRLWHNLTLEAWSMVTAAIPEESLAKYGTMAFMLKMAHKHKGAHESAEVPTSRP